MPAWKNSSIKKLVNKHSASQFEPKVPIASGMFLPNTSGDHVRSIKRQVPVLDEDLANKKYVDDSVVTPAGSQGWIQYNQSGAFGAEILLFWDKTNNRLGVGTNAPEESINVHDGQILIADTVDSTFRFYKRS